MKGFLQRSLLKGRSFIKRFSASDISDRVFLGPNVQILGIDQVEIKENCTIGENSCFTINNRNNKTDKQLIIGANVYIGRDCFFSVGKSIGIGEYSIFGNKVSLLCSDHIFANPLEPYSMSGNSYTKSIKIGVNCWLGHDVSVIGNVSVGHGSIVGAKTIVTKDVPPFSMVVGNPGRIIKTFDFESNSWVSGDIKKESQYLNEDIYLNYLKSNSKDLPFLYHSASSSFGDL